MSVDLPAPFSPQIAWISPAITRRFTFDKAFTPGNSFVIERISKRMGSPCVSRDVISPYASNA